MDILGVDINAINLERDDEYMEIEYVDEDIDDEYIERKNGKGEPADDLLFDEDFPFGDPEEYELAMRDKDMREFLLEKIKFRHTEVGAEIDKVNEAISDFSRYGAEFELISGLLKNKKEYTEVIGTVALLVGPICHIYDDKGMYVSFIMADKCMGDVEFEQGNRIAVVLKRLHILDAVRGHIALSVTKLKKKKEEPICVEEHLGCGDIVKALVTDFDKCFNIDYALSLSSFEIAEFFAPGRRYDYAYALAHSDDDYEEAADLLGSLLEGVNDDECLRWIHVRLNSQTDDYIEELCKISDIMEANHLADGKTHITAISQIGMQEMAQIFVIVSRP